MPQFPGSDTTSAFGTLSAAVIGSGIQFVTTNNIDLNNQSVPLAPAIGGGPGTDLGQIGLVLLGPGAVAAVRGAVSDVTSGVIPFSGATFDPTQVMLSQTAGSLDYDLTSLGFGTLVGTTSVTGSGQNGSGTAITGPLALGTLMVAGGIQTLTLPLSVDVPFTVSIGGGGTIALDVIVSGQIVATAAAIVPEPSTTVLACLAAAGLAMPWIRRRQRQIVDN